MGCYSRYKFNIMLNEGIAAGSAFNIFDIMNIVCRIVVQLFLCTRCWKERVAIAYK